MDEITARKEAAEKENTLLRREVQKIGAEIDEYRRVHQEDVRKIKGLQDDLARATGEIQALKETIRQMKNEDDGKRKLLKRYENPNTPGDTSWNDKRR